MKVSLKLWQTSGFLFTAIFGCLLHFLYNRTNRSIIAAPFSAVNESTWEHMKLLYFPMLVFTIAQYQIIGRSYDSFMSVKLIGTLTGLLLIPIIYYTYTGAFGSNADWFNIAIFFIAAGAAYYAEYLLLSKKAEFGVSSAASLAALCVIGALFVIFTFIQPEIPLFKDAVTGKYGM